MYIQKASLFLRPLATYWFTSTDGLKAMCHDKFAKMLVNVDGNEHVQTFDIDTVEFKVIIASEYKEETEED